MTLVELLEDEAKRLMRSVVNDSKYARHARADESRLRAESLRAHAARIREELANAAGMLNESVRAQNPNACATWILVEKSLTRINSPLTAVSRG